MVIRQIKLSFKFYIDKVNFLLFGFSSLSCEDEEYALRPNFYSLLTDSFSSLRNSHGMLY